MTPERWDEIQALFVEVVDLEPAERKSRLAVISRTDPELYSEVLSLLEAHAQADDLLDELDELPSPGGLAQAEALLTPQLSDPYGLVGRTVSHYRVLEPLGGGGMGVLYKAVDRQLDRTVALKFLPPQWSLDPGFKERFEREARAAAALDDPNVCTIYEAGETQEGQLFIAMALYQGETVKEMLARGPLAIDEAMNLAAQAASGVAAAHARGIVHRDIKPANLMVTEEGVLKILDFGLAKTAETALTETGMRLGTPAYMSPEQTRGEEITPGTDLWSLGVVLYEMLTGQRPFRAENDRLIVQAIRHEKPKPPGELRDGLPPDVENMLLQLLSKEPQARESGAEWLLDGRTPAEFERWLGEIHRRSLWQVLVGWAVASWLIYVLAGSLADSVGLPLWFGRAALLVLALGLPVLLLTAFVQPRHRKDLGMGSEQPGITRFLTWRNAVLGGVAAFALLGIGTAGYMAMRSLGIGPAGTLIAGNALQEGARLVLADFAGAPEDSALARTVTEALRIDLSQSRAVTLAEPGQVRRILGQMERPEDAPLDLETAREVAVRGGMAAVIGGEVRRVGGRYVLTAQVVAAEEGNALVSQRETAASEEEIIPALDRLSKGLRERIGESLKTIRASPPLEGVTTSSLPALEKWAAARSAQYSMDIPRALALYEEAARLDTTFALAYAKIAVMLSNLGGVERERAREAATKAFQFRHRLPDMERYYIEGIYHFEVTGDLEQARSANESFSAFFGVIQHNVGVAYYRLGDYEAADSIYAHVVEMDSGFILARTNLARTRIHLGRLEEADSILRQAQADFPDNPYPVRWSGYLAAARGRYADAAEHFRAYRRLAENDASWGARTSRELANVAAVRGRLEEAVAETDSALWADRRRGMGGDYLLDVTRLASALLLVSRDPEAALAAVSDGLREYPLESLPPYDRPYEELAWLYAAAGRRGEARDLLAAYEREIEPKHFSREVSRHRAQAELALADSDPRAAIREVDLARRIPHLGCRPHCTLPILGRAYEMLREPDSALAAYEGYIEASRGFPQWDALYLANIYERLGQLYDERGDWEKAAEYYGRLMDLWKDADPELQPRVQAAQQKLN